MDASASLQPVLVRIYGWNKDHTWVNPVKRIRNEPETIINRRLRLSAGVRIRDEDITCCVCDMGSPQFVVLSAVSAMPTKLAKSARTDQLSGLSLFYHYTSCKVKNSRAIIAGLQGQRLLHNNCRITKPRIPAADPDPAPGFACET